MTYSDVELNYKTEAISLLSPHLLKGVIDLAVRPARTVTDGNLIFMVNDDGSMVVITFLPSQEVAAGNLWEIDGAAIRCVMCAIDGSVHMAVRYGNDLYPAVWNRDFPLDMMRIVTGEDITSVSGLDLHNGKQVYAYVDDSLEGPFTVAGGTVNLPRPGAVVAIGLEPAWFGQLQPLRERLNNAQPFRPPSRIFEIELALKDTAGVTIGTNGGAQQEVYLLTAQGFEDGGPLQKGGHPAQPMLRRLYTGYRTVSGLLGWSEHPYATIGRPGPMPVHIKAIRYEVATHG